MPVPFGAGTTFLADTAVVAVDGTWSETLVYDAIDGSAPPKVERGTSRWELDAVHSTLAVTTTGNSGPGGGVYTSTVALAIQDGGRTLRSTSADVHAVVYVRAH